MHCALNLTSQLKVNNISGRVHYVPASTVPASPILVLLRTNSYQGREMSFVILVQAFVISGSHAAFRNSTFSLSPRHRLVRTAPALAAPASQLCIGAAIQQPCRRWIAAASWDCSSVQTATEWHGGGRRKLRWARAARLPSSPVPLTPSAESCRSIPTRRIPCENMWRVPNARTAPRFPRSVQLALCLAWYRGMSSVPETRLLPGQVSRSRGSGAKSLQICCLSVCDLTRRGGTAV